MTIIKDNILIERMFANMEEENKEFDIGRVVTAKDKEILRTALDGINGLNFNPIAVVSKNMIDYYFICKVETIMKNIQMKMAKVYIKIQDDNKPRLLSILAIKER